MVTRSPGLLEKFLSNLRALKADALIPDSHRKGAILDVGCGTWPNFLDRITFRHKTGIDQTVEVRRTVPGEKGEILLVPFTVRRGKKLPFGDGTFKIVTLLAVLEHLDRDNSIDLLSECLRVLDKDGIVILTVPAAWTDGLLRFLSRIGIVSRTEIEDHQQTLNQSEVMEILSQAGFEPKKCRSGTFEMKMNIWATASRN